VVEASLDECQVVTLSDYGKGLLTDHVLTSVLRLAESRGIPTIVDPKGRDYSKYRGAFMVTPNRAELAEATGMKGATDEAIVAAARKLMDSSGIRNVLVTRSQDGMTLVTEAGDVHHIPARAREVFDVSGAGDTVVATLAAALAVHNEPLDAARLANLAGGIVVGKIGTATATAAELRAAATTLSGDHGYGKIMKLEHVEDAISGWKAQGLTVGFTNGCFDLLHPGHISLLRQARSHCDKLIVGLNSDASVSRLKGPSRPIQKQDARAQVLAALQDVDAVVLFDEDTPMRLITALLPDVLVKGADYTVETVVGADLVTAAGGRVVLAQLEAGFSTTQTVASISGNEAG
jgi:D-beta-D-heptose 7-phosphate kinase/D-beta-D-heptose 1-phosphate adenosyltransferase